ncbi:hypothetical protein PTI98_010862 [Pleurotus ostreatus]|nr:hypothetical protein PTI98_010862 [Pleurotus ostreatus]
MHFNALSVLAFAAASNAVILDSAKVIGTSTGRITKYLGIPYAKPPIGDRRLRLPEPNSPYFGVLDATVYGPACPQHRPGGFPIPTAVGSDVLDLFVNTSAKYLAEGRARWIDAIPDSGPENENCLSINVQVPSEATSSSRLPVLVWIYGGGFEAGTTRMYNGGPIVERSIDLGEPIIYVSMNYRLNAFGFLAGKEIRDAKVGNLGLHDQREAFRWVQKYIANFGGDPQKVTIWGESAGAISVSLHMLTNGGNTNGLFRGAFMQSGAPIPVGDHSVGQKAYDAIVTGTGCTGAPDTLSCLRKVSYGAFKAAVANTPYIFSYQSLIQPYPPRVDGVFLTDHPQQLVKKGSVADVPFVTGGCDDEATMFSLSTLNVTTSKEFKEYIKTLWLPKASRYHLNKIMKLYPDDVEQGSPYDTGSLNALSPQFKRFASFQGDAIFQGPRRYFLQQRAGRQNTWSYITKRLKWLPFLGSFHLSDLMYTYSSGELQDYLIHFVNSLDPNGDVAQWPEYTPSSPNLLTFEDDLAGRPTLTKDTFRGKAIELLTQLLLENPV